MNEMIERVASAIWANERETDCNDYNLLTAEAKEIAKDMARAAIAAMREPTEGMLKVRFEYFTVSEPWSSRDNRRMHYQAMIDAALKD